MALNLKIRTLSTEEIAKFKPLTRGGTFNPADYTAFVEQLPVGGYFEFELAVANEDEAQLTKRRLNAAALPMGKQLKFGEPTNEGLSYPFEVIAADTEAINARRERAKIRAQEVKALKAAGKYEPAPRGRKPQMAAV
jgi:hypothetical protein